MEFANPFATLFLALLALIVLSAIVLTNRGAQVYIRRVPGVDAMDEVVGRAVELGRPVLFSIGLGTVDMVTLQAITVIGHVARLAARFRTRVIVPTIDPMLIPIIEEVERDAYEAANAGDAFDPDDIRFLSGEQFAYAAGVVGIMHREQVGANFFFGTFAAESLVMAESGQAVGAAQIAGTPDSNQIPFFLATCDYVIMGEEYYAVTALMSDDPVLKGSLVGQDYTKLILLLIIIAGILLTSLAGPDHFLTGWLGAAG